MRKLTLLVSLLIMTTGSLFAQNDLKISGKITDKKNQAIPFVNVVLLSSSDSSLVSGGISGSEGEFLLTKIASGDYLLKTSVIGYEETYREINLQKDLVLGNLPMNESIDELDAVVITGQKPLVVQEVDKLVFNVKDALVTTGNSGLDILAKTPGVWIDHEGNIQLNGKSGTKVMINGKMSYMSGKDLSEMLENLNASDILSIEVMTNPSAKFSAEGGAGILNIVLAKKLEAGIQGSAYARYEIARENRYKTGLSANFMKGKLSGFVQSDFQNRKSHQILTIDRTLIEEQTKFEESSDMKDERKTPSFRLNLDYDINKDHALGAMISLNSNTGLNKIFGPSKRYNQGEISQSIFANNLTDENRRNQSYHLNYQWKIDSLGQKLKLGFDYDQYDSEVETINDSKFDRNETNQIARPVADNGTNLYSFSADYERPLTNSIFFESGYRLDVSDIRNDIAVDSLDRISGEEQWSPALDRKNDFSYKEWVNAGYVNFKYKLSSKFSVQAGLRGEHTRLRTRSIGLALDSVNNQDYFKLFPTFYAQYQLSKMNSLGFTYSKRINRPSFSMLNPFVNYLNPNTGQVGNPELQPEFVDFGEVKFTWLRRYTFSLNYTHTNGMIADIPRKKLNVEDSDNTKILLTRENINTFQDVTLSASLPISVTKWWESYNRASVYYQSYKVDERSTGTDLATTAYFFMSNNTFLLPKDFKVELTGMALFGEAWGVFQLDPIYRTSLSINKNILKERLSLNVTFNDLLNTSKVSGKSTYQQESVFTNNMDRRSVRFTLRYNFKSGKDFRAKRRGGDDSLRKRAQ